ncbi:MAG: hypothetical protein ABI114_11050 [Rhodanobacter sp.]
MLYYRAAKRAEKRNRRLALLDNTAANAGGKSAQELFKQLGDTPE